MIGLGSKTFKGPVWILAILLLVSTGIAYRIPAHKLKLLGEEPVMLSVPLSNFPKQIGNWVGSDINIPATRNIWRRILRTIFSAEDMSILLKRYGQIFMLYIVQLDPVGY